MFLTLQHHMNYCSNPFFMGCMPMNPRLNFFMGMACATAGMPFYPTFQAPVFSFPYMMPSFSYPTCGLGSNPFASFNSNLFNSSSVSSGSVFTYSGMTPGIGSMSLFSSAASQSYIPPVSPFQFTSSSSAAASWVPSSSSSHSSSAASVCEPQGVRLNKNKNEYGPAFLSKVKEISKRLNCNYRDLLGVMNSESGIRADAKNPNGSATGLIQFVESTANRLGTTTAALRQMSPIEQLDYVEKYLTSAKRSAGFSSSDKLSGGQLYALIFLPARAGREVLTQSGESYYSCNRGLDKNKDGKITKQELDERVKAHYVSDNSFLA